MEEISITRNINPTLAQVEEWTKKHGKLKKVVVKDRENGEPEATFYFKKPSLNMLKLANQKLMTNRDTVEYAEILIKNLAVNGLECIKEDEEILIALIPIADQLSTSKIAEIEKN